MGPDWDDLDFLDFEGIFALWFQASRCLLHELELLDDCVMQDCDMDEKRRAAGNNEGGFPWYSVSFNGSDCASEKSKSRQPVMNVASDSLRCSCDSWAVGRHCSEYFEIDGCGSHV